MAVFLNYISNIYGNGFADCEDNDGGDYAAPDDHDNDHDDDEVDVDE